MLILPIYVHDPASFVYFAGEAEPQRREKLCELGGDVRPGPQRQFDFAASFGRGVEFWSLVGDEVRFADSAQA